jgi:hypothetical protein
MPDERKADRFAIRRDSTGWSIFEIFTGEVAVIALTPQTGLSEDDAQHTAELLNRRARQGDRSQRQ